MSELRTPLEIAVQQQDLPAIRQRITLGDCPQDLNHQGIPVLYDALRTDSLAVLALFEQAGADWSTPYNDLGYTPLIYASLYCRQTTIAWLLQQRQSIDQQTARGITVMHVAAQRADLAIARFLLEEGADPFATSQHGEVPLLLSLKARSGLPVFSLILDCYRQRQQPFDHLMMDCVAHIFQTQYGQAGDSLQTLLPLMSDIPSEQQIRDYMLAADNGSSYLLRSIEKNLDSRLSATLFALLESERLIRASSPVQDSDAVAAVAKRWRGNGGL